ncbi:MAG: hemolysin family protein [Phenylobacterium sp.]|uniref:hemolysin family protein n=1 Tax=Phenylobacterium sp. TaxID=1871053 RepID=UPI002734A4DC|nr:hemolysin family protein [Phenylobacterium sp.]MDP3118729.1 hemolysin family protein [Phenylobacterium sp.]
MTSSEDRSPPEPDPPRQGSGFRAILKRFGRQGSAPQQSDSPAEPENRMVRQAEAFQSLRVDDVMTPRADIVAVELTTPFGEVVDRFIDAEHSRMPIYRETLDDPVGVVHVKDVFRLLSANGAGPKAEDAFLHRVRRDALYVPASMRAADLLLQMQAARTHMALVIDEFGGTDGLVTLEDLIEAVVGDIDDEHDVAQAKSIIARPGGVFEADARAPLEELEAAVGQALAPPDLEEEIDTVGGLVTALAGRVPQRGELIEHPAGFELQVMDADPRRVKRVRLRPTPATPAAPSTAAPATPDGG